MANLWYVGATLGVLASMSGTTGKQLFRFSELQSRKGTKMSAWTAKVSRATALLLNVAVGPLIDMASYAFAPQSLIAPLGALDVVWNTLSAPCTLGEKLTPMTLAGVAIVFGGAVTTSIVGGKHDGNYTVEEMEDTLVRWRTLIYLLCVAAWILFNIKVLMPRSASARGEPWTSGDPLRGLSLGVTAGSLSGNMWCVKAFVEIVQASIVNDAGEYWAHWLPYVVLVGAVFFAVSNLFFLDKAMREYEALFMGAVFEGSLILSASVSGFVVFDEWSTMSTAQIAGYWTSLGLIIAGIHMVAKDAVRKAKEAASDSAADVEEGASDGEPQASPTLCGVPAEVAGGRGDASASGAAITSYSWDASREGTPVKPQGAPVGDAPPVQPPRSPSPALKRGAQATPPSRAVGFSPAAGAEAQALDASSIALEEHPSHSPGSSPSRGSRIRVLCGKREARGSAQMRAPLFGDVDVGEGAPDEEGAASGGEDAAGESSMA